LGILTILKASFTWKLWRQNVNKNQTVAEISSAIFLPAGVSMGPGYVLHLANNQLAINSPVAEAREKLNLDLES